MFKEDPNAVQRLYRGMPIALCGNTVVRRRGTTATAPVILACLLACAAWVNCAPAGTSPNVYLTNVEPTAEALEFCIAGGTNAVIYDLLVETNLTGSTSNNPSWRWAAQGYTASTYSFARQKTGSAFYAVGRPAATEVAAWGDDSLGQCDVPAGLTNAVAVAGGAGFSVALRSDGSVEAWGDNTYGETNGPPAPANVVAISAGAYHGLALRADGSVSAWGSWSNNGVFAPATVPQGLTGIIGIAAGADHDAVLKADGTLTVWGYTNEAYDATPPGLQGVGSVAAGSDQTVAVMSSGRVKAWGVSNPSADFYPTNIPADLTNAAAVAASVVHSVALRGDGTVEAWGNDAAGQTNVPPTLRNVAVVTAGASHSAALGQDGTVTVWGGFGTAGPAFVPQGLTGALALRSGANHCLAILPATAKPSIVSEPAAQSQVSGGTVTFTAKTAAAGAVSYQWRYDGTNITGGTNATLTLTNVQTASQGNYTVVITTGTGTITSSNASLTLIPWPVPNVTTWTQPTNIWANYTSNVTLSVNVNDLKGAPASGCEWMIDGLGRSSDTISPTTYTIFGMSSDAEGTYSAVVSNPGGTRRINWRVRTANPGGLALWGADNDGQVDFPTDTITNVTAIAAGMSNSVAVLDNGTVMQWGANWTNVPANLTNAVAVATGYWHTLALRSDGTVTAWGNPHAACTQVPKNLSGVKAVAAGWNHSLALLTNGTVITWGADCTNLGWHLTELPAGLSNVSAIAAGSLHSLALLTNGTVVAWGYGPMGQTKIPPGLSNVVAIAAGGQHNLALKSDGTVTAWGDNRAGQCNVPPGLSNVTAISAGWAHSVALKNDGTLVAWGDNSQGQSALGTNLTNVKAIAAGGRHTLAAITSPMVRYPVDVSKDLLLIYNANSVQSSNLAVYYLKNRPMVGNALVMGLPCTVGETIMPADFTNEIYTPLVNWLSANPTIRPRYVVLFLDMPSRVNGEPLFPHYGAGSDVYPSVSYQLATGMPNWQPMVTHINMGDSNACMAYINKLTNFAARYSPGKLVISASGSGDTNFVVDDIRHGAGFGDDYSYCWWLGAGATNGALDAGVSPAAIDYAGGTETYTNGVASGPPHLTQGANMAGYFCWGVHSDLGASYACNVPPICTWSGNSSWYLISTVESFNGQMYQGVQGNFIEWFSPTAFGGTNYSNTPVGAVTHVDEPGITGIENEQAYFGLWAAGEPFALCAWNAVNTPYYQAVGDPFVCK
jgi:alpha-tubulin suppressor-like RCC1 family protein